jgi:hypothetical protein
MIIISKVDVSNKADRNRFINIHFDLYKYVPQWVPPFKTDIHMMMNPNKHPYYEHSDAEFFIAEKDEQAVGKIAALENKPFNAYHGTKDAEFYLFDCINDQEVANALFKKVTDWAKARGLNRIIGPK